VRSSIALVTECSLCSTLPLWQSTVLDRCQLILSYPAQKGSHWWEIHDCVTTNQEANAAFTMPRCQEHKDSLGDKSNQGHSYLHLKSWVRGCWSIRPGPAVNGRRRLELVVQPARLPPQLPWPQWLCKHPRPCQQGGTAWQHKQGGTAWQHKQGGTAWQHTQGGTAWRKPEHEGYYEGHYEGA
jgi:hypothetical protein